MKIGSILGALSPGLSATGLFGNAAQGTGLGMLGAMSPLLGLLLAMKKKKKGQTDDSGAGPTPTTDPNSIINVTPPELLRQNPMLRAMGSVQPPSVDPNSIIMSTPPELLRKYGIYGRY